MNSYKLYVRISPNLLGRESYVDNPQSRRVVADGVLQAESTFLGRAGLATIS